MTGFRDGGTETKIKTQARNRNWKKYPRSQHRRWSLQLCYFPFPL
jgi:hypothetical protein